MATRNLTIMFTDIKGFTERTSGSTRDDMNAWLAAHERLLVPVFEHFAGTIVKTIGDAFLVYFESPTDAVLCGVTIQEVLRQHNANASERERLEVRVAINVGEVQLKDNDLLGEAVNIAARLEGITEAGEVWFTDAVFQTMNRSEAPSSEVGERVFKGIPHPIRVYRVITEPESEFVQNLASHVRLSEQGPVLQVRRPPTIGKVPARGLNRRTGLIAGVLGLAVAIAVAITVLLPSASEQALRDAQLLLEQGRAASALTVLDRVLAEEPTNLQLTDAAIAAAESHLQQMEARGEHPQAKQWLELALQNKPYLEPLRPHLMSLDAQLTVLAMLDDSSSQGQYYPQPLKAFLAQYRNNAAAPYELAERLDGQWYDITRIWLYRQALDKGHPADEGILLFATAVLSDGSMNWERLEMARQLLLNYYPEGGEQWAREALAEDNVLAFSNAWLLLKDAGSELDDAEYYHALFRLIGAQDEERVQESLAILTAQHTIKRRQQVINFLGTLVTTYPQFINHGVVRDALHQAQLRLLESWPDVQSMTLANRGKRTTAEKLATHQLDYPQAMPIESSTRGKVELERLRKENELLKKLLIDRELELHNLKTSS